MPIPSKMIQTVVPILPDGVYELVSAYYHYTDTGRKAMEENGFVCLASDVASGVCLPGEGAWLPGEVKDVYVEDLPDGIAKLGPLYVVATNDPEKIGKAFETMDSYGYNCNINFGCFPKPVEACYYLFGIKADWAERCMPEGSLGYDLHELFSFL